MNKQKTAMLQLVEEFERIQENDCKTLHERIFFDGVISIIENRFFEIEKEQIIKTGDSCALRQYLHHDRLEKMSDAELKEFAEKEHLTFGEQHYNETFTQGLE